MCKTQYYLVVQTAQSVFSDDFAKSSLWCSSTCAFMILCHSTQILGMGCSWCCSGGRGCEQQLPVRMQGCHWILLQGGPFISEQLLRCHCSSKEGGISDAENSWRNTATETGGLHLYRTTVGLVGDTRSSLQLHVPSLSSFSSHPSSSSNP